MIQDWIHSLPLAKGDWKWEITLGLNFNILGGIYSQERAKFLEGKGSTFLCMDIVVVADFFVVTF